MISVSYAEFNMFNPCGYCDKKISMGAGVARGVHIKDGKTIKAVTMHYECYKEYCESKKKISEGKTLMDAGKIRVVKVAKEGKTCAICKSPIEINNLRVEGLIGSRLVGDTLQVDVHYSCLYGILLVKGHYSECYVCGVTLEGTDMITLNDKGRAHQSCWMDAQEAQYKILKNCIYCKLSVDPKSGLVNCKEGEWYHIACKQKTLKLQSEFTDEALESLTFTYKSTDGKFVSIRETDLNSKDPKFVGHGNTPQESRADLFRIVFKANFSQE